MNVLITGANRGIGLGLVKAYAQRSDVDKVYACCRNPQEMWEYTKVEPIKLDVTNEDDIENLRETIGNKKIDILINNAGVYSTHGVVGDHLPVDYEDMMNTYNINTLGALRVSKALIDNVKKSNRKQLIGISSVGGSITNKKGFKNYGYGASKVAMNMIFKQLHLEYPKVNVLILHPGWVKTDMGTQDADITLKESVIGLMDVIDEEKEFSFYDYQGKEIPW